MTRIVVVLAVLLALVTCAHTADKPKEGPSGLERKLHGMWEGPACGGRWAFAAESTFNADFRKGQVTLASSPEFCCFLGNRRCLAWQGG